MMMRFAYVLAACFTVSACAGGDDDDNGGGNNNAAVCGDGTPAGNEQCDDGNTTSGDGCSATCQAEQATQAVCGDGIKALSEECDDANTTDGDGCSATCTEEDGGGGGGGGGTCNAPYDLVLMQGNGNELTATGMGDTTNSSDQVAEALCDGFDSGAGNDHVWKLTLTDARDVYIVTDENSSFDTVLRLQTAPCDTQTEVAEFAGADGCSDGLDANEFLGYVTLPAGTYYVVIDGYTATDMGMYAFTVVATPTTCGDGVLDALEFCDDGNTSATVDGCNAVCEVDDGYTCDFSEPSVCTVDNQSTAPGPGDLLINEVMAADSTIADTNCDGSTTGTADEFIEIVNVSGRDIDLDGVTIEDFVGLRHTFGAMMLADGDYVVVWNNGAPSCTGVTNYDVASSGQLGFNDDGDTITLLLGTDVIDEFAYLGTEVVTGVSFNREIDADPTAEFVPHDTITGAMGDWSPGTLNDGSPF